MAIDPIRPGTRRPGGRTARNRDAVFAATLALLAEGGYAQLSIDAIAARAGVHKTTVYRRWQSKERLVAAAFMVVGERQIEVPDTGDIDDDARALARSVAVTLSRPETAMAIRAMVGATPTGERQRVARQYWASRFASVGPMVQRAIARGELPSATDPARLVTAIAAPLFFQVLVLAESPAPEAADLAAAAALAAARAGLFVGKHAQPSTASDGVEST